MPRRALVILIALAVAAPLIADDQPETPASVGASINDDPWAVIEPELEPAIESVTPTLAHESQPLVRRSVRNATATSSATTPAGPPSWWRSLGSLAAVVALIVLLAWGYRAAAGGGLNIIGRPRRPGVVQIVSRAALSPRQSICLLRVGPRMVLVGVTPEQVRRLDVIEDAGLVAQLAGDALDENRQADDAFQATLQTEAQRYDEDTRKSSEEPSLPDEVKLLGVKRRLAGALARARKLATSA